MRFPEFITKKDLKSRCFEEHALIYDTSTNAPTSRDFGTINMSELSPFRIYYGIPVPGQNGVYSDTVEGIWQGLKIVKGKTDFSYFKGKGRKRNAKPKGHLYGSKIYFVVQARELIYIPSYQFMWENRIDQKLRDLFVTRSSNDLPQYFLDVDTNFDIHNKERPFAHSALVVNLIKQDLERLFQ